MEKEEITYNGAIKHVASGKKTEVHFKWKSYTKEIIDDMEKAELFQLHDEVSQALRDINTNCEIQGTYSSSALIRKKYYNLLISWIVAAKRKYTLDFYKIFYRVCHEDLPEALVEELKAKSKMLSDMKEGK